MHSTKLTISVVSNHANWHVYSAKWQWKTRYFYWNISLSSHLLQDFIHGKQQST